jgi:hypothetical protein
MLAVKNSTCVGGIADVGDQRRDQAEFGVQLALEELETTSAKAEAAAEAIPTALRNRSCARQHAGGSLQVGEGHRSFRVR